MRGTRRIWTARFAMGIFALGALLSGGCSEEITIIHYPAFYSEDLKTIAVLPLADRTFRAEAGLFLTERLLGALAANGSYRILAGWDLAAKLKQAGVRMPDTAPASGPTDALSQFLSRMGRDGWRMRMVPPRGLSSATKPTTAAASLPAGDLAGAIVAGLRKVGAADAVLFGEVMDFSSASYPVRDYWYYEPYYYGPYGHGSYWYPHGWGYRHAVVYPYVTYSTYSRGRVAAFVELVSVADGRRLHVARAAQAVTTRGYPTDFTPESCLSAAADAVAAQLVAELAPSPWEIKIKPAKVLRTSLGRREGEWEYEDDFEADAGSVFVIVRLPHSCHRNTFRVTITRKDDSPMEPEAILSERTFTWTRKKPVLALEFAIADLVGESGSGTFHVNFHNRGRVVFDRKFKIRK